MKRLLNILPIAAVLLMIIGCGAGEKTPGSGPDPDPNVVYKLHGVCFGPYLTGNPNYDGLVSVATATKLLDQQKHYVKWIRTYTIMPMPNSTKTYATLAKERGLKVAAGCWLAKNPITNTQELQGLINACKAGEVDIAIIGSETLYRNDLTDDQLIAYMKQVKTAAPGVLVTTNDTWSEILSHPKVMAECDLVIVNIFPYWEGVAIQDAAKVLNEHYQAVVNVSGGKQVIVGESGWPSDGNSIGAAVASGENAFKYFINFVSWARAKNVDYFYFEAYDEPWKAADEGPQGAHWGIWDNLMTMKPERIRVFNNETVPDNWTPPPPPEPLGIKILTWPAYNNYGSITGKVAGPNPTNYKVAVYIYVNGGWWTKPYWNSPYSYPSADGKWSCAVTTGGIDQRATKFAAFLLERDKNVPLMSGGANLHPDIEANSIMKDVVDRPAI